MTPAGPLRPALVAAPEVVEELRAGLAALGLRPAVVASTGSRGRLPEELLRRRGFTPGLSAVPAVAWALRRADADLAHAFAPADAVAATLWGRRAGRPVVFTCTEVLDRPRVADRRLRLPVLVRAVEASDAVRSSTEEVRDAMRRWMAVDAPVLAPRDAASHVALYRALTGSPDGAGDTLAP